MTELALGAVIAYSVLMSAGVMVLLWLYIKEQKNHLKTCQVKNNTLSVQNEQLEKEIKQRTTEVTMTHKDLYTANILLKQEKEKSNAIIKYMADGVIMTDLEGKIIEINPQAMFLFGKGTEMLTGKHISEIISDKKYLDCIDEVKHNDHKETQIELSVRKNNNQSRTFHFKITGAVDRRGNPLGIVNVIRDITANKELETLKNVFIRTISHELRTPLTTILGFLEILQKAGNNLIEEKRQEYLDVAHKAGMQLQDLINNLLDISLMESKKLNLSFSKISLYNSFKNIVDSFIPQAEKKGVKIYFRSNDEINPIVTDEGKIQKVFANLLSNAVKFTETGHINIYFTKKDGQITTHVADTGIGIDDRERDLIFESFTQVDDTTTRKYDGLGIGLSIAKNLVGLLGGAISVESEQGKGSVFSFTLPMTRYAEKEYAIK